MSQKTKVKKDKFGLYVHAGGYIARPLNGTCFKEGDQVKSHHFGGSIRVGVGTLDANFRKRSVDEPDFEYWVTTLLAYKVKEMSQDQIVKELVFSSDINGSISTFAVKINKDYAKRIKKKHVDDKYVFSITGFDQ